MRVQVQVSLGSREKGTRPLDEMQRGIRTQGCRHLLTSSK